MTQNRLNAAPECGMVPVRGETDAGTAGTQPARDNLAEASKRRRAARSGFTATGRAARFSFGLNLATLTVSPSGRATPTTALPNPTPAHSLMPAMPPQNPRVWGSAPSGSVENLSCSLFIKSKSVPQCSASPIAGDGRTAGSCGGPRALRVAALLPVGRPDSKGR